MQISGPSKAPMRETKASKMGIVLAMIQAIRMIPNVQLSQVIQCVGELLVRWREPRRILTNMNFAGIFGGFTRGFC